MKQIILLSSFWFCINSFANPPPHEICSNAFGEIKIFGVISHHNLVSISDKAILNEIQTTKITATGTYSIELIQLNYLFKTEDPTGKKYTIYNIQYYDTAPQLHDFFEWQKNHNPDIRASMTSDLDDVKYANVICEIIYTPSESEFEDVLLQDTPSHEDTSTEKQSVKIIRTK